MVWHSADKEDVAMELDSQPKRGLTDLNAGMRRSAFGVNTTYTTRKRSGFTVFMGKLLSPLSVVLLLISGLSAAVNIANYYAGAADLVSLVFNLTYAGTLMLATLVFDVVRSARELCANSTIVDIKRSALANVRVRRNGIITEIPTEELVPGDIIHLEAGDIIPADGRLLITRSFMCDERVLTGDDTPSLKDAGAVLPEETPLAQRCNMAYAGTVAVTGHAMMLVTETGSRTRLALAHGKRPRLISNRTPLVRNAISLKSFGVWMILCSIISVLSIYALGLDLRTLSVGFSEIKQFVISNFEVIPDYQKTIQGRSGADALFDGILFFLTLVICTVPVGLPQNVMRSIAKGIAYLRNEGIMLRRFKKTEVIGCTSVICTDKSGTLTLDSPCLVKAWPAGDSTVNVSEGFWSEDMKYLMRCCTLCCDRNVFEKKDNENEAINCDPTEEAIFNAFVSNGGDIDALLEQFPRVSEIPFDASRRLMTVIYEVGGVYMTVTKGAPEVLVAKCAEVDAEEINSRAKAMFDEGLKVIAVAVQSLGRLPEKIAPETVERDLTFVGLLGLEDPCREEVREAVDECTEAGIRTVMITGDHPETAASLARRLHILGEGEEVITGEELAGISDKKLKSLIDKYAVFARITPEDKVRIIDCWQSKGACVLMTAGGMTDAPALHKADISCSAEETATDVAADAADISFADGSFANICSMIRRGRQIRKNLRNLTEFSMTCAIAQTLLLLLGGLILRVNILGLLPLTLLNLMLFLFVQPCFANEPCDKRIMKRMPDENKSEILGKFENYRAWIAGIYIVFNSVIAYLIGIGCFRFNPVSGDRTGITMAFAAMSLGLVLHAILSRSERPLAAAGIFRNIRMLLSVLFTSAAVVMMIMFPWAAQLTGFSPLTLREWCALGVLLFIQLVVWEYPKLYVAVKIR